LANKNAVKAFIISEDGQMQVSSEKNIDFDSEYIFSHEDISEDQLKELLASSGEGVWRTSNGQKEYLETIQIPNVNWYLMISMTNISAFAENDVRSQTLYLLMAGFLILLFVLTYLLFKKMHQIELDDASKDELTGLYNRTATGTVLNLETKKGFAKYGTVFILDVDDFKTINDTGGHTFGDEVLGRVADALQEAVGRKGVAIRWGGDEFIGILAKEEKMPAEVIKKLMEKMEQIPLEEGRYVSGSFGAVKLNGMDFQQAVIAADHAMYESKNSGKKRLTWYEEEK
jgi:diguanylate cyclase (GGDEF)-like protein